MMNDMTAVQDISDLFAWFTGVSWSWWTAWRILSIANLDTHLSFVLLISLAVRQTPIAVASRII